MSFDDNYYLSKPLDTFLDGYPDHEDYLGEFDPSTLPPNAGSLGIQRTIAANAAWLQAEPRTSLSIIFQLFPDSVRRMSDFSDVALVIGASLWSAGYVPRDSDSCNPTWHWLDDLLLSDGE